MRRLRVGAAAGWLLAAGCAHHGETGTSAYVLGTLFILIGLALAVGIILGNK